MDKYLLKKYIKGECNSVEARQVFLWINSEQFDSNLLRLIEQDLDQEINTQEPAITNESLQKKITAIYDKAREETIFLDPSKSLYGNTFLKIAASLLLIISIGILLYDSSQNTPPTSAITSKSITKENDRGRKSTIFLPDGSVIQLNSESSIRYDEINFEQDRTVFLAGEGFFEVAEDSIHPFSVISDQVAVTALGTSFNVDSYREKDNIQVALVTGKVLVKNLTDSLQNQEYFLNPGQSVSYHKENKNFSEIIPFEAVNITGWKDGILYFDRADLSTVLNKLERWFAVDFELLNESHHTWRYTSQFKNQNLKNIMESLSFTQNFNYEINGKKVYIEFK